MNWTRSNKSLQKDKNLLWLIGKQMHPKQTKKTIAFTVCDDTKCKFQVASGGKTPSHLEQYKFYFSDDNLCFSDMGIALIDLHAVKQAEIGDGR